MNNASIKDLPLDHRIRLHFDLIDISVLPSCMNCEHNAKHAEVFAPGKFTGAPDTWCTQFNATPPLKIIVCGCPQWSMAIPF